MAPRKRAQDAALVVAMAGGSTEALEDLYAGYGGTVMALLLRILRTRAEAEELLQEVFLELWRRAPQYEPRRASVSTWVATIARSRALDALRARNRRGGDQHVPSDDANLSAAPRERPDEQAARSRRSQAVHEALGRLSEDQRQVMTLSYFRGLSHSEIARELELPVGTVKSRILAAMKVLRSIMVAGAEEGAA